jgi:hypothetical protein
MQPRSRLQFKLALNERFGRAREDYLPVILKRFHGVGVLQSHWVLYFHAHSLTQD